nr:apolipoprotein N-acyltransferase [Propionibacterium sp.]
MSVMTASRAGAPADGPAAPVHDPGFVLLLPFALGAGLLASLAYPPAGAWPVLFVAVAVLARVVALAAGTRQAAVLGLSYGLAFNLTTLSWQAMIQWSSYLALVAVESVYFAVLGALLHAIARPRPGLPAAIVPPALVPPASAAVWVLVEAVQARFPFGGFGWTKLGYAMVDTPLAGLYPLVGSPGVTFVVALVGHAAAWSLTGRRPARLLVAAAVAVTVFAAGAAGTLVPAAAASGTLTVGWVQGGASGEGFYGIGGPGETGRNHAAQTARLVARVEAGELPRPDFIVWPENGTDADPLLDPTANAVIANAVAEAGVPILVGTPTAGPGPGQRQTTAFWWTNAGVEDRYDKRNLVPFGEWIPFRELLLPVLPILAVVGDQAIPGTEPGVLHVAGPDGRPLAVGIAICYEVAFPETLHEAITAGAEVMIVGSNNAMFQGSPQIDQQFAITRVRAAETRRQVLVVTTSGVTGLIDEHGRVAMRAPDRVGASGVVTLNRSSDRTPLLQGGWAVEYVLAAGGLAALAAAFAARRRRGGQ